jgi:signal transduction histidine kinase
MIAGNVKCGQASMRIRAYLFLMAAAILIPVVVFSGLALGMLQQAEKEAALGRLSETAKGLALLVDRELYSAEAALNVLAASPALADGELADFHRQALTANRSSTGWGLLLDGEGHQLVNTRRPYGSALPATPGHGSTRQVMDSGATVVSGVMPGAREEMVATINVPVPAIGRGQTYVLAMAFSTDHFNQLIERAGVPPGWLVALIDRNGRFIARNVNPARYIGQPARPELVRAAAAAEQGQLRHRTLEGTDSYDVFSHSAASGWTVAVAAPIEMIERSARKASLVAALGLLAAVLGAAGLAAYFGRLHVRSIGRAVEAANALGDGHPPEPMASRVLEVGELHTALHAAGRQLLQAQAYRRQAEAERQALLESERAARVMAEQQSSAKDQFLAMLGHELRNPLAPISTAAQLLRLKSGDQNRVRYASDVITRQVDHMNSLLGDMLDVSRVTRGLVALTVEDVDLKAVLERAREQTHAEVEVRHHQLELRLPPHPLVLRGDPTRLIQIFANLLGNAAKYTPPHGHIVLSVQALPGQLEVTVQDNGEGIAPVLLPHIFELFSQGERAPDRSQGGLGLGLALVHSLVQLHGGTVSAESAGLGKGSSFTVSLPWEGAPLLPAPAQAPAAAQGGAAPLRIMLVDDNIDGAISLSLYLREAGGHKVCTYYDGRAALEWASGDMPEVFILDIGLPDMSGYELASRLRAMAPFADAVYIALTGYGQPQDRDRASSAGFDYHLAKPADPQAVLALLAGIGRCQVLP